MKLGFYWMKKTRPNPGQFSQTAHDVLASLPLRPRVTKAVNIRTNARINDGDIITIWAKNKDDLPEVDIINFQWDIVRMASLCGGAEPVDEEEDDDDDDMASDVLAEAASSVGDEMRI
jgi:hypothetical protein